MTTCYDCYLVDLDGTLYWGNIPIPQAAQAINSLSGTVIYTTNNASRTPANVAEKLTAMGFPATADSVITSAQLGVELLRDSIAPPAEVLVLGTSYLESLVNSAGYTVVREQSPTTQAVIQGHSPETGWAELSAAARAIRNGARYIATNKDTSLPSEKGLNVGNGAMVGAVEISTGITARNAGKPAAEAFTKPAQQVQATTPLVIGDRLDTDIQGAVAAGYDSLCVLTGVTDVKELCNAPQHQRPTYVRKDLTDLPALASGTSQLRLADIADSAIAQALTVKHDSTQTATVHFTDKSQSTNDELNLFIAWAWKNDKKIAAIKGATPADQDRIERWRYSDQA